MELSFLGDYIVAGVLGICMCVGFVIKNSLSFIPNKYIPLIMLILGAGINVAVNWGSVTVGTVLGGMISGLASTGMYEALRNLIKNGKK